jgi:hypothetical protein
VIVLDLVALQGFKIMSNLLALKCKISRGGFADERVFTIKIEAMEHSGAASRYHMWNENRQPIEEGEPEIGEVIDGMVAARVIETRPNGNALVSIPDGEVIEIPVANLMARPPVDQHVPI